MAEELIVGSRSKCSERRQPQHARLLRNVTYVQGRAELSDALRLRTAAPAVTDRLHLKSVSGLFAAVADVVLSSVLQAIETTGVGRRQDYFVVQVGEINCRRSGHFRPVTGGEICVFLQHEICGGHCPGQKVTSRRACNVQAGWDDSLQRVNAA